MIGKIKYIVMVAMAAILLTACNFGNKDNSTSKEQAAGAPQTGDHVANNLVCMVNNIYIGTPQSEVDFEGKTYYVSCESCKDRIVKEKAARTAIDLYSVTAVDKADAYIVLIGDHGEVAYFENEQNYKALMAKSNLNKK